MSFAGMQDYRRVMRSVLVRRIQSNRSYSLRAFARDLRLPVSHLSGVLNYKKNLSRAKAAEVAPRLGLNVSEQRNFVLMTDYAREKSDVIKEKLHELEKLYELMNQGASPVYDEVIDLPMEKFKLISQWYHIPILEMSCLTDFEFSAENIARKLGISVWEAADAMDRLLLVQLLKKDQFGNYQKTHKHGVFHSGVKNEALRSYHRQMLEKALDSIDRQDPDQRILATRCFSIDPRKIAGARKLADKFLQELSQYFDKGKQKKATYQLNIQLFNLLNESPTYSQKESPHE